MSAPAAPATGTRRRDRAVAVAATTVAALLVWIVGEPLLGHELVIEPPGQSAQNLDGFAFTFITLGVSLAGWGVLALLERFTSRARTIWTVVAVVVVLLSFLPFLSVEATTGTVVVLSLAHLVVGAVLIPLMLRTTARPGAAA
ncbi:DUF6069 family protein [Actinocorallia sp. A-T 12471]|uniref:DUF6069 family protein n=1 Tax=Actinocorallia sp. A-T 12471 TaxID=3089813 RepID=UPI0029D0C366|nr:DUF6069 family protein [Actinocorallia sp. A-T 12471]MDX6740159.1 DUF6069 family protein [Actinocorallia sp. A-T 12471]